MSNNNNDRCRNVQSEFGEGCYRSGDIFFTYCTPFSNELLSRRCDNDNGRDNNRNNNRDRERNRNCNCNCR